MLLVSLIFRGVRFIIANDELMRVGGYVKISLSLISHDVYCHERYMSCACM